MLRLVIILLAIAIGVTIGIATANRYQRKKSEQVIEVDADYAQDISAMATIKALLPWVIGFAIIFGGLMLLVNPETAPIDQTYQPASFENGAIKPHQFGEDNE
ncbi:MAG: hypothetical protein HOI92_05235 [Alphaproteobacteria bacterium]|nr:hypothetical protein [Alphaproteobacteria bacterium]MDG2466879.1 hypothetical protein [Alphaproteobacteria bacterium]